MLRIKTKAGTEETVEMPMPPTYICQYTKNLRAMGAPDDVLKESVESHTRADAPDNDGAQEGEWVCGGARREAGL
jgi:hypothetical protein